VIERLPQAQRRILAVVLLLLTVVVIARVLVVPIWTAYLNNRDAIAQLEDNIARYLRLSTRVQGLRVAAQELDESADLDRYVLAQNSEPLAAAALQDRVKSVVTSSGGTLTSTQVLPVVSEPGFKRIIVNVRMAVSMAALQQVLYQLETGLPYLLVDDLVILSRAANQRRRQGQAVDMLDVRFNLYGYMREPGAPA
jgi:general secretion pathway protein M